MKEPSGLYAGPGKFGLGLTEPIVWSTRPEIWPEIAVTSPAALTVIVPVAISSESNDSKVNL